MTQRVKMERSLQRGYRGEDTMHYSVAVCVRMSVSVRTKFWIPGLRQLRSALI